MQETPKQVHVGVEVNREEVALRREIISQNSVDDSPKSANAKECPECGSTMVERDGPNTNVCKICRHEWR